MAILDLGRLEMKNPPPRAPESRSEGGPNPTAQHRASKLRSPISNQLVHTHPHTCTPPAYHSVPRGLGPQFGQSVGGSHLAIGRLNLEARLRTPPIPKSSCLDYEGHSGHVPMRRGREREGWGSGGRRELERGRRRMGGVEVGSWERDGCKELLPYPL